MEMHIKIVENGCRDKEITILDTRLPYFYAKVSELFSLEPEEVEVVLVGDKKEFYTFRGEETERELFAWKILFIFMSLINLALQLLLRGNISMKCFIKS